MMRWRTRAFDRPLLDLDLNNLLPPPLSLRTPSPPPKKQTKTNKKHKYQQEILKHVRALAAAAKSDASGGPSSSNALSLSDLALPSACREVVDKDAAAVLDEVEAAVYAAARSVLRGAGFSFDVPSRAKGNQLYVPQLDRIVLKDSMSARPFASTATCRKSVITARILGLVHELCRKRIHVTKRDLFYTDVKLFEDQSHSDAVLDDVACMLGCTRSSLHVVASEKGVVVGRLQFREDGDAIDCSRMGVGGKAIPPNVDRVTEIRSDALFILLVEKDAAFMRLAEDRFYAQYPCIIITAKGQPDVASRLFLRKLRDELKIPVLALVDSDPYGLKILSVRRESLSFFSSVFCFFLLDLDVFFPQKTRIPKFSKKKTLQTGLHEGLDEHELRLLQPHHARHQVARRPPLGPRPLQHPAAVPPADDRRRRQDGQEADGGGLHQGEPGVGQGAGDHDFDESESRDPGAVELRVPVPEPGLPAAEAAAGGLDLKRREREFFVFSPRPLYFFLPRLSFSFSPSFSLFSVRSVKE